MGHHPQPPTPQAPHDRPLPPPPQYHTCALPPISDLAPPPLFSCPILHLASFADHDRRHELGMCITTGSVLLVGYPNAQPETPHQAFITPPTLSAKKNAKKINCSLHALRKNRFRKKNRKNKIIFAPAPLFTRMPKSRESLPHCLLSPSSVSHAPFRTLLCFQRMMYPGL